ncbi:MAG: N-6 DNA methylase [Synergistales bacterium]|nr:N-6 DNA methylase [Synergistales bacterium]
MTAPQAIVDLVERFDRNVESYRSGQYNETQLRREFIDPLFKALGWDVDNEKGYAEAYKDVVHEDAIKVGASTKAPDYCFRIGGTRKFFIEAKKPSVNLKDDISPAFQLRRYSWSAKLPLGILTDFEELAVYDGRVQPVKNDKASKARVKYFTYKEYVDRWDEIATVFSREEVLRGSFDKYVESSKAKRGTAEVDTAFLKEIEAWRDMLARNIALRNPDLTTRELNFAVQRTIDRIVFLRICEDRGIEKYGWLQSLLDGQRVYPRLCEFFRRADERYNSGLFHFQEDPTRQESPDELTLSLDIDDKILKDIIRDLYYPDSPYEFSVLPPEILGQVYEQFLGKVISLTAGHRAKVEYKPEVRKAGGVYYTPSYIVNYIVENTVGKLLEGQTPTTASELRVLDPACGSGSFLIGAYQRLLDWHRDWYVDKLVPIFEAGQNATSKEVQALLPEGYTAPKRRGRKKNQSNGNHFPIFQAQGGEWKLTTEERKRILLNNIYGVDIDPQAVEVTKLSLHLKVLEGESEETLSKQLKLFQERALPDLGENIKCGNSLIGWDILEANPGMTEEEIDRINPFDWDGEFPDIMRRGGFDAVIGNPPWGSLLSPLEKMYLFSHYVNRRGEAESHLFFVENSIRLLSKLGALGFITPNTWLSVLNSKEIRKYLLENITFYEICELSKYIFKDAPDIVPILIFVGRRTHNGEKCVVKTTPEVKIHSGNFKDAFDVSLISQDVWRKMRGYTINLRATAERLKIIQKCKTNSKELSEICDVIYGIKTGNNDKYLSSIQSDIHNVKALKTGEITRYQISWKGLFLWWCPDLAGYRTSPIEIPKIIIQYIRKLSLPRRIVAAMDTEGVFYPLNNYSYIISDNENYSLTYVFGIINSKLINFYYANTFIDYNIKPTYLQQLPIRTIDFSDPEDVARHDKMVALVERMLDLHKRLAEMKAGHEKTLLQRQIEATDKQIDALVYELYGLTEEEIKIIE